MRRAQVLLNVIAEPAEVAGVTVSVEGSAGVVLSYPDGVGMIELLRRADVALYQANLSGQRVSAYRADIDHTSIDRLSVVAELRTALTEAQLSMRFQPIVDLETGRPISVEAFVRWHHPRRGLLQPDGFMREVQASDLIGQFTRFVLGEALRSASGWADPLPVAVNLSPRVLQDTQLAADITDLLRHHSVEPNRLILEISENVVLSPSAAVDHNLRALRDAGIQFSVDDFGTGFSSLTFLTRIPVDELKIDKSFIQDSPEADAVVRAIVDLGVRLGIRVVAEGVESTGDLTHLIALGCKVGQGYLFSRPVEATELPSVLRQLADRAHGSAPEALTG